MRDAAARFRSGAWRTEAGVGLGGGEGLRRRIEPGVRRDGVARFSDRNGGAHLQRGDALAVAGGGFRVGGMVCGFGGGCSVVAGRSFRLLMMAHMMRIGVLLRSGMRGVLGGEREAGAMLGRGFHLSGEDKGRAERQQDAGQPSDHWGEHGRKIVPGAARVNAAPGHRSAPLLVSGLLAVGGCADGLQHGRHLLALRAV